MSWLAEVLGWSLFVFGLIMILGSGSPNSRK